MNLKGNLNSWRRYFFIFEGKRTHEISQEAHTSDEGKIHGVPSRWVWMEFPFKILELQVCHKAYLGRGMLFQPTELLPLELMEPCWLVGKLETQVSTGLGSGGLDREDRGTARASKECRWISHGNNSSDWGVVLGKGLLESEAGLKLGDRVPHVVPGKPAQPNEMKWNETKPRNCCDGGND